MPAWGKQVHNKNSMIIFALVWLRISLKAMIARSYFVGKTSPLGDSINSYLERMHSRLKDYSLASSTK